MEKRIPWLGWHVSVTRPAASHPLAVRRLLGALGLVSEPPPPPPRPVFDLAEGRYTADGLSVSGRNLDELVTDRFAAAYRAGMDTGHKICRPAGSRDDIHIEWRVYTCVWAARHGAQLGGDFVECGVNTGMYSKAICEYLDFANLAPRKFYLFDTYAGIPEDQMSDGERGARVAENASYYEECYELAKSNFAAYPNVELVRGRVPESLADVPIERVAYLSIDMNIAQPEVAVLKHFWDRLVPGALVVLDDFGWLWYREQYEAITDLALQLGVVVYTMPTGQGLIIKPAT